MDLAGRELNDVMFLDANARHRHCQANMADVGMARDGTCGEDVCS